MRKRKEYAKKFKESTLRI